MSIYGPRIRLPKISLPLPHFPKINTKKALPIVMIIAIIAIILMIFSFAEFDFNSPISVSWKNNPLDLKKDLSYFAELEITLKNINEQTTNISLEVATESSELIIFCPDKEFPNVAPNNQRKTTCVVRRNPNEKIFSGNYTININTNLGSSKTTLEIIAN